MARPSSPELYRSGRNPALEPDNMASRLEATDRLGSSDDPHPVPEENQPGAQSGPVQDKPDGEAFTQKFQDGLEQAAEAGPVVDDVPETSSKMKLVAAGSLMAVLVAVFVIWRKRR